MSTLKPDRRELATATMAFAKVFDAWVQRASVAESGESVPRLQLLNELHCNGPQKMADLADTLGVTPRAVTSLVDALEAEDLVRRTAHPTDRRITMVEITGGVAVVEQGFSAFESAVGDLFDGLDDAEAEALQRALSVLRERIGEAPPRPGRSTRGIANG
jgi:DNA-binding MarR family transcriptional regulator